MSMGAGVMEGAIVEVGPSRTAVRDGVGGANVGVDDSCEEQPLTKSMRRITKARRLSKPYAH